MRHGGGDEDSFRKELTYRILGTRFRITHTESPGEHPSDQHRIFREAIDDRPEAVKASVDEIETNKSKPRR
jgi:hypothetical protein